MKRAASLACAVIAFGATLLGQGQYMPRRDQAIELLQADAASVPPEFEADILLRLSSLPKVDKEWRRELLDTAYMRAYAAPEQHRRSTTQQIPPDSRQGAQLFAYATALTRVTLQVRAVELMVFVDPLHARDLFEWIDLNLGPGVCADPLVPSVDEYYTALGQIARLAYRGNHSDALNFFELYLWRAHLPSEMPAVARAIQRFPRSTNEAAYLEGLFRLILLGSSNDAPGFSSAALDITAKMTDLQIADTGLGVLGSNVMDALRTYLLAQLKAPRCADNVTASVVPSTFNAALRRARADYDVKPMDADAARYAVTTLGIARIDTYWQTIDASRLHDAAVRLRGPGAVAYPLRVRQTGMAHPGGPAAHRRRAVGRRERAGGARLLLPEGGAVHLADRSDPARRAPHAGAARLRRVPAAHRDRRQPADALVRLRQPPARDDARAYRASPKRSSFTPMRSISDRYRLHSLRLSSPASV